MSPRLRWTGQKRRCVCTEETEDCCVDRCGWRAFVKKTDDFLFAICTEAFTLLGHEAACFSSSSELTINQGWESLKITQTK